MLYTLFLAVHLYARWWTKGQKGILINAGVALVGVPLKSCSKNMPQTYKRTPMPKCDVITLRHGCSPVNCLHIFGRAFCRNTYESLIPEKVCMCVCVCVCVCVFGLTVWWYTLIVRKTKGKGVSNREIEITKTIKNIGKLLKLLNLKHDLK